MQLFLRILLWSLAILAVLVAGLFVYLQRADLSVYESQIEGYLSEKIGHKVDFDGLFELQFGRLITVTADDVRITNAGWPSNPELIRVGHLNVVVELRSLFRGPVVIEDLDVERVVITLERDAQGRASWQSGDEAPSSDTGGGIDPGNFVAFRQIDVQDVRLGLTDPARRRPLDVMLDYLTVTPDASNVLDLELEATLNELALRADGTVGPWTNLIDGEDISTDMEVLLAESRLDVEGHIEDLFRLEGVEIDLNLSGPQIDRVIEALGMPPFAAGGFQVTAEIDAEDDATLIDLGGNLGEITLYASGSVEKFIQPSEAGFDFDIAGPDAKYVAEVFGLERVTQAPFRFSGRFDMRGNRYTLTGAEALFAAGDIGLDGWIDLGQPMPDGDVTISSSGPDLSAIGALSGVAGIPAEPFAWQGRVRKDGSAWRFDDFEVEVGENRLQVTGELDTRNADLDQIEISAKGPDVSVLRELTGLQGIPARPYDISVLLRPADAGVRLESATGVFGDNLAEVDGVLGLRDGLDGTDLEVRLSGPELHNVALLTGVPFLPTGPFEVSGGVSVRGDTLAIVDATAVVTGIRAGADGTIGLTRPGKDVDIRFSAEGADLAGLAEFDFIEQFANQPFDIGGRFVRDGDDFELDTIRATVGSLGLALDGDFNADGSEFDFEFRADAPDADVLDDLELLDTLPQGAVVIAGRVERVGDDLELHDTEFRIGDYAFSADGTLSGAPMSNDSDLRFAASGPELRQLGLFFGYPDLPPKTYTFSFEVNGAPSGFAIQKFVGRVGENTIAAGFTADLRDKPTVTGKISSTYIDLESRMLRPDDQEKSAEPAPARQFIFSDAPLDSGWLHAANFDIDVSADRAILSRADVRQVHVRARLWDGALDIAPLSFRESAGSVDGRLHIEPAEDGYRLDAGLVMENMHLGSRAPDEPDRSSLPPLGGSFEISGHGASLHEIFASSNGKIDFRHGAGKIRRSFATRLFGDLATQIIRTLNPLSRTESHTNLECSVMRIDIVDGLATIQNFALQSDRLTMIASGRVNLETERIDITMRSKPREGFGVSLGGVANSFLKLGGTLANPGLQIDAASSVTTTGAAVATGGLSLLAKSLWDRVTAEADLCKELGENRN